MKDIDYTSKSLIEEELLQAEVITIWQYNFIKQFQKDFNKQKIIQITQKYDDIITQGGKYESKIEKYADNNNAYLKYYRLYNIRNITFLENIFCLNLSAEEFKNKYINNDNKFNEIQLINDLTKIFKILDTIETFEVKTPYEQLIYKLNVLVKERSKNWLAKKLYITDRRTIDKILNGDKNYSYKIYERMQKIIEKSF